MVNRGYALMPSSRASIDILMGESVVGTFDTSNEGVPAAVAGRRRVAGRPPARRRAALNPRLKLFTLDYWDPADRDGVRAIYREQRARGFAPYVSTPQLDRLIARAAMKRLAVSALAVACLCTLPGRARVARPSPRSGVSPHGGPLPRVVLALYDGAQCGQTAHDAAARASRTCRSATSAWWCAITTSAVVCRT